MEKEGLKDARNSSGLAWRVHWHEVGEGGVGAATDSTGVHGADPQGGFADQRHAYIRHGLLLKRPGGQVHRAVRTARACLERGKEMLPEGWMDGLQLR